MARQHEVSISVGGKKIGGWTEYAIESNMLAPADGFSLARPVNRDAWDLCALDSAVTVLIDGTPVMTGLIDSRQASASAGTMTIAGRDKAGRLVQESAPGIDYSGLKLRELVKRLASPWFTTVTLSDARNRTIRRGRGYKAPSPTEPLVLDAVSGGRVEPGQMRWSVIEDLVTQAGYLAWSSSDGKELVIGPPNYRQEIQWHFVHALDQQGTVLDMVVDQTIADCYSRIIVVGSGRGTDADYGTGPANRVGEVLDANGADGIGGDFQRPKRLVLAQDSLRSADAAQRIARRDANRRNQGRRKITIEANGHGQIARGSSMTIFAPNTIARCVYDSIGLDAAYLVTSCKFIGKRTDERTTLELVPRGTEMTL